MGFGPGPGRQLCHRRETDIRPGLGLHVCLIFFPSQPHKLSSPPLVSSIRFLSSRGSVQEYALSKTNGFAATDLQTSETVAIKLESIDIDPSILQEEVRVYAVLRGEPGIPRVHWYGTECDFNAMVFDLLGPSLEDLFNFCSRKFSLKTVLMLADQLIMRLQQVHSKGIIH